MKKIVSILLITLASTSWTETLTFEQVLREARERSPDLTVAKAKYIQAHSLMYKTISRYLPRIDGVGNYSYNFQESSITMPTGPGQTKKIVIQPKNQFGGQVNFSQMVLSPWVISQLASLGKYEESIKLSVQHARKEILFGVAQLFYAMASSKKAVAVQNRLLEGRRKHEHEASVRYAQGYTIEAEYLRAQIDTLKNEKDVMLAENTYESTRLALATMLGREADFDIAEPEPAAKTTILPWEEVQQFRLDLRAARLQADYMERNRNGAFWRYLPDLSFFMNYKGADHEGMSGKKHSFSLGVNLVWNIFDGGLREAENYENRGRALEARGNARIKELQVKRDVETAKLDEKNATANKEKAEKQLVLAKENFRVVSKSKELGVANYLEYTDAQDNLSNAEIGLLTQSLQADLATLKLLHVQGQFE